MAAGTVPTRVRSLKSQVELAIAVLRRGGIVIFPTDTVYGLGADPCNNSAVERLYEVKQRPRSLALPLLAAGVRQLAGVAQLSPAARFLGARFWPGALTLVVPRSISFPDYAATGGSTVAVRVPNHRVPRDLARGLGHPIVGTSANLSGRPSACTANSRRMA